MECAAVARHRKMQAKPGDPSEGLQEEGDMSVTIQDLQDWRERGRKFAMVTAYDALTARIVDDAGIPVILVGDSVANVLLGYPTTIQVTMPEMLHHARAVARGAREPLLVGDMP